MLLTNHFIAIKNVADKPSQSAPSSQVDPHWETQARAKDLGGAMVIIVNSNVNICNILFPNAFPFPILICWLQAPQMK